MWEGIFLSSRLGSLLLLFCNFQRGTKMFSTPLALSLVACRQWCWFTLSSSPGYPAGRDDGAVNSDTGVRVWGVCSDSGVQPPVSSFQCSVPGLLYNHLVLNPSPDSSLGIPSLCRLGMWNWCLLGDGIPWPKELLWECFSMFSALL